MMMSLGLTSKFCVAPMLGWTDRSCRRVYRLLTKKALLYSEMIPAAAIAYGQSNRYQCDPDEGPVSLQLGGSDPKALYIAAGQAKILGYSEVNLNVGCPSPRVQKGAFGAYLMKHPVLLKAAFAAMKEGSALPVSIKCRIGVDELDEDAWFLDWISQLVDIGCTRFIVHARKAYLKGLNPAKNRTVPPLNYDRVFALKAQFPHLEIVLNGGLTSLETAKSVLDLVDGVMLGRGVYQNPWMLHNVDNTFFGLQNPVTTRAELIEAVFSKFKTCSTIYSTGLRATFRHLLGLYRGQPNAKAWRSLVAGFPKNAPLEVWESELKNFSEKNLKYLV